MNTESHWRKTAQPPRLSADKVDCEVDVAIVGGGITGISTAYLMKRAGFTVALVERNDFGGFDTANTTAHLTSVPDQPIKDIFNLFGAKATQDMWGAGRAAIDCIVENCERERIECDLEFVSAFQGCPLTKKEKEGGRSLRINSLSQKTLVSSLNGWIPYLPLAVVGSNFRTKRSFIP